MIFRETENREQSSKLLLRANRAERIPQESLKGVLSLSNPFKVFDANGYVRLKSEVIAESVSPDLLQFCLDCNLSSIHTANGLYFGRGSLSQVYDRNLSNESFNENINFSYASAVGAIIRDQEIIKNLIKGKRFEGDYLLYTGIAAYIKSYVVMLLNSFFIFEKNGLLLPSEKAEQKSFLLHYSKTAVSLYYGLIAGDEAEVSKSLGFLQTLHFDFIARKNDIQCSLNFFGRSTLRLPETQHPLYILKSIYLFARNNQELQPFCLVGFPTGATEIAIAMNKILNYKFGLQSTLSLIPISMHNNRDFHITKFDNQIRELPNQDHVVVVDDNASTGQTAATFTHRCQQLGINVVDYCIVEADLNRSKLLPEEKRADPVQYYMYSTRVLPLSGSYFNVDAHNGNLMDQCIKYYAGSISPQEASRLKDIYNWVCADCIKNPTFKILREPENVYYFDSMLFSYLRGLRFQWLGLDFTSLQAAYYYTIVKRILENKNYYLSPSQMATMTSILYGEGNNSSFEEYDLRTVLKDIFVHPLTSLATLRLITITLTENETVKPLLPPREDNIISLIEICDRIFMAHPELKQSIFEEMGRKKILFVDEDDFLGSGKFNIGNNYLGKVLEYRRTEFHQQISRKRQAH